MTRSMRSMRLTDLSPDSSRKRERERERERERGPKENQKRKEDPKKIRNEREVTTDTREIQRIAESITTNYMPTSCGQNGYISRNNVPKTELGRIRKSA